MNINEELDTNIQIVKEINDDNQKSANELWIDEKTSKNSKYSDKFYQDFYPIIVNTSSQQLNKTKEICHICDTSLITLLTNSITETQNKLPKYKKTKDKSKLKLKDISVSVNNPIYYKTHKLYDKSLLIDEDEWIKENNIDNKIQKRQDKIKKFNKNNIQKQLIIFKLTNNQTYKDLLNLNRELTNLKRLSISNIFERLINLLANETPEYDKMSIFFLTENNNNY